MLLTRRAARLDPSGERVPLDEQDRSGWNASAIAEGCEVLATALMLGQPGPYQLQAAIAACHCTAPTAGATDWPQIRRLYSRLAEMVPSGVVRLNRAVAVAMADGPAAALPLVEQLDASGSSGATISCPPPGATCCAARAGRKQLPRPTAKRSDSRQSRPNAISSAAG